MNRLFRRYISDSYQVLFLLELGIFAVAFEFSHFIISPEKHDGFHAAFFIALISLSSVGMGLYRRIQPIEIYGMLLRILASFLLTAGLIALCFQFLSLKGLNVFGLALLFALIGVLICRVSFLKLSDIQSLKRRVLVLGAGRCGDLVQSLERVVHGFQVIGHVRSGEEPVRVNPSRLIDLNTSLQAFSIVADIDEIIVAPDDRRNGMAVDQILDCKMAGFEVTDLLNFFEREAGLLRLDCLHPGWLVFSRGFKLNGVRLWLKRWLDVSVSLILLAMVWPILLLTVFAILIEDGRTAPFLYQQSRVGLNGKLFEVIKFRSMRLDAEMAGAQMARMHDDRITRVGRLIRKYRIDELPQLFNVLKGEMSFVGPRPERPEFVKEFSQKIPYYAERHRVKPGITGWAQLCYPYGANLQDAVEKLQYDLYYVKNYSTLLDLLIILETIEVVLWGRGAR